MSTGTIYILVDFDNLDERTVGRKVPEKVDHLVRRAAKEIMSTDAAACRRVVVRFYGGWYEDEILTRRAQETIAEIPSSPFLFPFRLGGKAVSQHSWLVRVQLAYGLLSVPEIHMMHTHRRRQRLGGIRVADPVKAGCDPSKCRILGIRDLVRKGRCTDCGTKAENILWRVEQKLVDVMLATDVLALSSDPDAVICVVSSDDDFWPAMLHVSRTSSRRIYHMHAIPGRSLRHAYSRHADPAYVEITL